MGDQELAFQYENHEFTATEIQELLSLFVTNDGTPNPGSDSRGSNWSTPTCSTIDHERKLRRMISNRESARRSRWRKRRLSEDLTNEVNRLMTENRDLKDRLGRVLNRRHMVLSENDFLWMEFEVLRARLSDLCQILVAMQFPS